MILIILTNGLSVFLCKYIIFVILYIYYIFFMILYTDDDIPIVYNPIQFQDEKILIHKEPLNTENIPIPIPIPTPEKINVNIIVRFICCCFRKNLT